MEDKNILCSIRVYFETKVLFFLLDSFGHLSPCALSSLTRTVRSIPMSLTGESVNFEKTGYIQIIVGIPFFVGMQKEAVNTILNIVKFTTTPHNI